MTETTETTYHCRRIADGDTFPWLTEEQLLHHVRYSNQECEGLRRDVTRTETVITATSKEGLE